MDKDLQCMSRDSDIISGLSSIFIKDLNESIVYANQACWRPVAEKQSYCTGRLMEIHNEFKCLKLLVSSNIEYG